MSKNPAESAESIVCPPAPLTEASYSSKEKDADAHDIALVGQLLKGQGEQDITARKIPLIFKNLTVQGPPSDAILVKSLPRAILNTFGVDQFNFLKSLIAPNHGSSGNSRKILSDFTGVVKPGEMLLVLGRPGSGCSTFLRTAANYSSLKVSGDLIYADKSAKVFKKEHQRDSIYLPEEDRHIASLTVRQTITFALRMNLPNATRGKVSVEELVETSAKLFGIHHVLDTPVGGAFFPGVSGGERKR